MNLGQIFGCIIALITASPSFASVIVYSDQVSFGSDAGTLSVEDFNGFAPAADALLLSPFDFGEFSVTVTANSPNLGIEGSIVGSGIVNGTVELALGVDNQFSVETRLDFDHAVTAFGFTGYDLSDVARQTDLVFNNLAVDAVTINDPDNNNTRFWGFISDTPFTSVTFMQAGGAADGFRMDDFVYSTNVAAVPEPSSAAIMSIGFITMGLYSRRRRFHKRQTANDERQTVKI